MRKRYKWNFLVIGVAVFIAFAFVMPAPALFAEVVGETFAKKSDDAPDFVPGQLLIKFNPGVDVSTRDKALTAIKHIIETDLTFISVLSAKPVFSKLNKNIEVKKKFGLDRWVLVKVRPDADIPLEIEKYKSHPDVEYVDPNYIRHVCVFPDDPLFENQWNLNNAKDCDIGAPEAWDIETGSPDVILAILDTGVKYDHSDLQANIWINEDEIPDNGIDDDNNNFTDDYYGYDFCASGGEERDNDPMDEHGHGTHCSGIASAVTNNGIGVAGVCWHCRIMSVRFINAEGWGTDEDAVEAIVYAVDNGADIISMSWGSFEHSDLEKDALDYAYYNGVVLAAAAGNYNSDSTFYPAAYDNVIAVAATDGNDIKASFSSYGRWLDVAAPGVSIKSTAITGEYGASNGTSMSCAHVAGLAGLVLSQDPTRTNQDVIGRIMSTTDVLDEISGFDPPYIGTGRINAFSALTASQSPNLILRKFEFTDTTGNNDGYPDPGETVGLIMTVWNTWLDATGVSGTISTDDPYVSIVGNNPSYFGELNFDQEKNNSDQPFLLYIHQDVPLNHIITINLELISGNYVKETSFDIVAQPVFKLHSGWPFRPAAEIVYFVASPTIFDIDNDGEKEVIFSSRQSLGAWGWVYVKKHDGTTVDGWPQNIPPWATGSSPAVGDIDGDGDVEVVIGSRNVDGSASGVYAWHHNGTIVDGWPVPFDKGGPYVGGPTLVDLNNDNDLEIIIATPGWVHVIEGNGEICETYYPLTTVGAVWASCTPAVGNIDNDKGVEIVARDDGVLKVFNVDPPFYRFGIFIYPVIVDMDLDGDLEIVAGNVDGEVYAWHHDGNDFEGWPQSTGGRVLSIALGDIDNDDSVEIVAGSIDGRLYAWNHDGTMVDGWPTDSILESDQKLAILNLDHDSEMEIFISNYRRLYVWNHDGTLICPPLVLDKKIYAYPAFDDIDNDGNIELAIPQQDKFFLFDIDISIFNPLSMDWPMYKHDPQHTGFYYNPRFYACGNVDEYWNLDITISDVVYLISYLFKSGPEPIPHVCCGDCNDDREVNILDVVYLINYLFKSGPGPSQNCCGQLR